MAAPVIWQNNFSFLQIGSNSSTFFYLSAEEAEIPDIGHFVNWLRNDQALNLTPENQLQIGGDLGQWSMGSVGTPATAEIILSRSVQRFVFSRIFGRIN